MAAMNMQMMARSLLIYRLTGSAAILGAISFAHAVPTLSLSLFGGVIADRVQKKYVMLIGQTGSAVVALGTALALTLGYLSAERAGSWWILVVASVLQGIVMALMMPSRQAILPEIVGEEQLLNAISLNMLGMNGLRLFAPALTGFLIDAFDFEAVYYGMTGMYLMAVVFIGFLPLTSTITIRGRGALADIKEGLNYLRHETTIVLILVLTLVVVLLSMPYMMLMPVFADDILKVGATGMGVLMSVSGIGAIIGSFVLASLPNRKRGLMFLASCVILSLALVGFSFSNSWPLSLALIVFVGLGSTGRMTLSNNLIQYYVEDEYRGRVMSVYMMEFGLTSFGTFAAGVMAEAIGVQWAVGGFALVLVFLSILAIVFVPRIRKLD
ncbi:Enterobactin exporter EntS [subsurface metagenome]